MAHRHRAPRALHQVTNACEDFDSCYMASVDNAAYLLSISLKTAFSVSRCTAARAALAPICCAYPSGLTSAGRMVTVPVDIEECESISRTRALPPWRCDLTLRLHALEPERCALTRVSSSRPCQLLGGAAAHACPADDDNAQLIELDIGEAALSGTGLEVRHQCSCTYAC